MILVKHEKRSRSRQNQCSRWIRIGVHDAPEWVFIVGQNMHGDRVKTDRRDSEKLSSLDRAEELTAVWVPGKEQEAMRDHTCS